MQYEWDEAKNQTNIEKHGINFEDAWEIFEDVIVTAEDKRKKYGERRLISIGMLRGVAVVVVHASRGNNIRVISIRKANKDERKAYATRSKAK